MAWQPPASDFQTSWSPPASDFAGEPQPPPASGKPTAAAGSAPRPQTSLWDKIKNFGSESVEAAGEGAKTLWDSLLTPGRKGAEAEGDIVRGVTEATGALGGSLAPLPSVSAVSAATPALSRGRQLLQDFKTAGVQPSMPAVGQGRATGLAANLARSLPLSPVTSGIQKSLEQTGAAAERTAAGFGQAATPEAAGNVAQNALRRFAGDKSQAASDYGEFDRLMHGAKPTQLRNTMGVLKDIQGRFPTAPGLTGLFTNPKLGKLAGELATQPRNTGNVFSATGGALTAPELKEMRTQIGYMIEQPAFGPEAIPKAQLRRLYGALTQDMQTSARQQGPAAVKALNRATINYGTRMRALEQLDPLLRTDAPEKSFMRLNAAAQGGNAGLLQTARNSMTPEEWGDIGAATIRKLGVPPAGVADPLGSGFSVNSFGTNYAKITDHAKDLLFGPDVPDSPRAGLEALSRVVAAQKNVAKLANTSHSGEMAVIAGTIEEVTRHIAQGQVPWAAAAGLTGAYGASKLLMSPGFTRWIYALPETLRGVTNSATAVQRGLASLQQAANAPPQANPQRPAPVKPLPRLKIGGAGPQGGRVTDMQPAYP